jgi:hypothetical protein
MEANTNFSDVLDEFHRERVEAIAMLERCLYDKTAEPLERWLEARIAHDMLSHALLLDLREALSHRLLSLRRSRLDSDPPSLCELDERIALLNHLHDFVKDWLQAITLRSLRHVWDGQMPDQLQ